MRRARAQVLVIFACALPVLLGVLGLALDGGHYFFLRRATQIAADAGARAAAVAIIRARSEQSSFYNQASATGRAIGLRNLTLYQLTGVDIRVSYHNSPGAAGNSPGWYTTTPNALTREVRAVAQGTFTPLFLPIVGINAVNIRLAGTQPLAVTRLPGGVLPLAICNGNLLLPQSRYLLWSDKQSDVICLTKLGWHGLVNLGGMSDCDLHYYPAGQVNPPTGAPPATGAPLTLDNQLCADLSDQWKPAQDNQTTQIVVFNELGGDTVLGCKPMRLKFSGSKIEGEPRGAMAPCASITQVE
jgi:Flp pilus assembly protein TadG